jgi:DNA-binding transcriptional LysR family regulator
MFFAARSYLDAHGHPAHVGDLVKHRLVVMADDKKRWEELYQKALPGLSPASMVFLRNNTGSTHFSSVANGAGIGALPTYVHSVANLVPLHLGINVAHDIWLTYRADAKRIPRIARTIEWIQQAFDPRRFPWFRDEFIHPDRFADIYKGTPPKNAFAGVLIQN